jgi:hypothetical protein
MEEGEGEMTIRIDPTGVEGYWIWDDEEDMRRFWKFDHNEDLEGELDWDLLKNTKRSVYFEHIQ